MHKIKPNPVTTYCVKYLKIKLLFVLHDLFVFSFSFFPLTESPDIEAEKQATCCTVNFSKNFLLLWPVTLPAEEEFLLETSISISCQGRCVFGRFGCIVCINGLCSK